MASQDTAKEDKSNGLMASKPSSSDGNSVGSDTSEGSDTSDSNEELARLSSQLSHLSLCPGTQKASEISGSPLLTVPVLNVSPPAQYGLIGADSAAATRDASESQEKAKRLADSRIFHNVAAPSSVFICGSQGSGKSNTLACLLENCLIPSALNTLPKPLAAIVFHYDSFSSDVGGLPCEAAYLATNPHVKVRVLCAPTNLRSTQKTYGKIPNITIEPLQLRDQDLNTKRMLDLMAVGSGGSMPLYMHVVNRVLREMRIQQQQIGCDFDYQRFKMEMDRTELTDAQSAPLKQRLDTLESFMVKRPKNMFDITGVKVKNPREQPQNTAPSGVNRAAFDKGNDWDPKPGQLTIVDLSCPCVTTEMACSLFNITLHLFLEGNRSVGRVVALDEAHKYMKDDSAESRTITDNLLSIIRLQRHLGVRVIISTQEPTVSPKLLDLCSVTVVHRFTSPDWLKTLKGHLAGMSCMAITMGDDEKAENGAANNTSDCPPVVVAGPVAPISVGGNAENPVMELFALIVELRTGQALVFAPSAIIGVDKGASDSGSDDSEDEPAAIHRLAHRALSVQIRSRLTRDGGGSVLAS